MAAAQARDRGSPFAENLGFLFLRLALGTIFVAHGAQKLFGWFGGPGYTATVQRFSTGLGIPPWLSVLVILTEFVGGILVILGVFTRLAAFALAVEMLVAGALVHARYGFFLNWENRPGVGHGVEMNLALLGMALLLLCAGPGQWALAGDTELALTRLAFRRPRPAARARTG
ncbi:MAG: DoxX family protein [Armatimonadetes bacterium]|nr:DoxX family protein [Armatimonadota bacterium]